ncbi:MAG: lmo0937 family membrane protein [Alphaproteobacteria bacterium]|nr:MAG: lmo0937 family membrane protein [Alphaproteobacteria bacterium]
MSNVLFIVALIFFISWVYGFFAFSAGALIHLLLVFALIAILLRIIRGRGI